jgi:hypothetical protein
MRCLGSQIKERHSTPRDGRNTEPPAFWLREESVVLELTQNYFVPADIVVISRPITAMFRTKYGKALYRDALSLGKVPIPLETQVAHHGHGGRSHRPSANLFWPGTKLMSLPGVVIVDDIVIIDITNDEV